MRLEQFEYLQAIDNYGSISAAARKLHITHQGLSMALRQLEEELQVSLIERNSQGVRLNDEGRFVLAAAQEFFDKLKRVRNSCKNLNGELHICSIFTVLEVYINNVLATYYHEYPDVLIDIETLYTQEVFDKIAKEQGDIGFVILTAGQLAQFKELYPQLEMQILSYMDVFIEISKYSELANHKIVSIKNLRKYKMALNTSRSLLKDKSQIEFYDDLQWQVQDIIFEPVRGIYESRICNDNIFGLSFMSPGRVPSMRTELVMIPLKENIRRYVVMFWLSDKVKNLEMEVLLDRINAAYPLDDVLI